MKNNIRPQKFSRLIQKELGQLFQNELKPIVNNFFITITGVEVTADLSLAKVYISLMLDEAEKKQALIHINNHKKEIRKILGSKIRKQVRKIPEIYFILDSTLDEAQKIDQILSNIKTPPKTEN